MPKGTKVFPAMLLIFVLMLSSLLGLGFVLKTVRAQQQSTGSYSDDFSTDSGLWQYLGSASRDPINQCLSLTSSDYFEGGGAFFKYPIQGTFVAKFSYKVGGGTGGDGFTIFFYKQQFTSIGNGDTLGFSSNTGVVPGYGVEFDGWQNTPGDFQLIAGGQPNPPGDPSADHIALVQDFTGNHLVYVDDAMVDDGNWHNVSVEVGDSFVGVFVDQGLVLLWNGVLNRTYDGFGFSGATGGGGSNYHVIGNFSLTLGPVPSPAGTPTPTYAPTTVAPYTPNPTATINSSPDPLPALTEPNQSISTFSDDFSADSGAWQFLGTAYRDATNHQLVLTDSSLDQTGIAFLRNPIQGSFVANFNFLCGGTKNDGLVMFFYKQNYPSNLDYVDSYGANAVAGGRSGFNSGSIIPGYGIEFDGWQNIAEEFNNIVGGQPSPTTGDPSVNHIALIKDFTGDHLAWVDDQSISANVWHQVSVHVQASSVAVYVDQVLVLQWNGTLNRTYDGFGFSASNGEVLGDSHIIDHFSIAAENISQPTLTTSCVGSVSQPGLNVQISGNLTSNGTGVSNAPILLSYSVTGGESWQDLTLVNTASDGSYSAIWFPSVTGDYLLKAVYQGNENYLGTSNVVNLALQPASEQSIFSVTSNSTISELSFDSVNKEFGFSVSGPNGTRGYVDVYFPKSLINDITGLKVYLDNSRLNYTIQSQGSCWLLYFDYHHSSHSVMISLGSSGVNSGFNPLIIILLLSVLLAMASVLAVKYRKNKLNYR